MTGREWQPGDVAMVTVGYEANRHVGWFDGSGWRYATDLWASSDPAIVTARPLVVIDPEDREQVERLLSLTDGCFNDVRVDGTGPTAVDLAQIRLREFASPTPPKPDEPTGLGAVVEDAKGGLYLLAHPGEAWMQVGIGSLCRWRDIDAVKVLDDGYKPGEPS